MKKELHGPIEWLERLNQILLSACCNQKGRRISLEQGCLRAGDVIQETIRSGNTIWWVGNGGSAAICSHLSQDLLNKLGARSFYLGDASLMTCMANDFGYEKVYLKPLEKLAAPGDLLIAISSSGKSENIVSCARFAADGEMNLISLSGFQEDNPLRGIEADVSFYVPASQFGLVEVSHEAILHGIIDFLCSHGVNGNIEKDPL